MASLTAILFVILFTAISHLSTEVSGADRMNSGERLAPGETLTSADGKSVLQIKRKCIVVLESMKHKTIWESKSQLKEDHYCVLVLLDGILTVRQSAGVVWHSNNLPLVVNSTSYLAVLPTMLVVYYINNLQIWSSLDQPSG